jgi:hypothetical protein
MKHTMTLSTCIKLLGLTMMIQFVSASSAEVVNTDLGIFISGGIGLDERQEMYANRDQYNLRLSFAKATGAYISGVNVTIEPLSAKGTAMHCPDAGPLLFLSLIPGKYRISAAFEDKTQVLTVMSPLASERVLYWH